MAIVLIVVLDTSNRVYCIATLIVCTVQCSADFNHGNYSVYLVVCYTHDVRGVS
jgi:hypothetical protein